MKRTVLVAAAAPSKGKNTIRSLMDFLRVQARLEANKETFSQFLGLSVSTTDDDANHEDKGAIVRADRFSFLERSSSSGHESLVFRYRFPPNDRLRYLEQDEDDEDNKQRRTQNGIVRGRRHHLPLSTYTSILDEVTTFGVVSASPEHPRPGVSVTMQLQWGPARHAKTEGSSLEEVDIVTTLTKKGRTLGFVRAEVRDPSNNDVICYFDHVKYLPPGLILSILLTPVGRWFLDFYSRYILPYLHNSSSKNISLHNEKETEKGYAGIMDSFQKTSDTTATFRVEPQHSNGFGGLHGGVQASLMERLGRTVALNELMRVNSDSSTAIHDIECERLQVSYQSSASRWLELRAHVMEPPRVDHPSVTIRIEILRGHKPTKGGGNGDTGEKRRSVVVSEGILTFVNASSKTKEQ